MKLLVIGATGGIGLETVKLALRRGHAVRAFARGAGEMTLAEPGLERWPGDATVPADLAGAVAGVDAVVMALGLPKTARAMARPTTLFSDATRALIPAMRAAGVSRLIAVTGIGAGVSYSALSSLEKIPFKLILGRAYADKDRQEALIKESGLDWTIVRPTLLTDGPARPGYKVLVEPSSWRNGVISRASVADFLVAEAETGAHSGGEVVLAR